MPLFDLCLLYHHIVEKSMNFSYEIKEALNKSGLQIAQTDFSSDCMKMTQEYLMYFKEFSCKITENIQARCVPRFIQCFPRLKTALSAMLTTSENADVTAPLMLFGCFSCTSKRQLRLTARNRMDMRFSYGPMMGPRAYFFVGPFAPLGPCTC